MVDKSLFHHPLIRQMATTALLLSTFAVLGTGLVALTYKATESTIAANERQALLANLNTLIPAQRYNNDLLENTIEITDPPFANAGKPITVYRAYRDDEPVAVLAEPVVATGYSGPIRLLIGIYTDGTLAGVRVLSHQETPGLGDAIEIKRSKWILGFRGKSLQNPPIEQWKVKKDGGTFDQFTGATITPRAIVSAIRKFLVYFSRHRDLLLTANNTKTTEQINHD